MRTSNLVDIQNAQLYIMDDIHRICVKNGIRYYLIGGSAIGAIRHQGFIPWDVDIDIAMPREDYELFARIASKELKSEFMMVSHLNDPYLRSPHILVVLKNSKIVFRRDLLNPWKKQKGLYVDILPLDKVPIGKQRDKQKRDLKILKKIRSTFMMVNRHTDTKAKRMLKKIIIPILCKIPTAPITRMQNNVAQRGNMQSNYDELCSMLSHYDYDRLCMPKEWFGKPKLMSFSGRTYYVPQQIEKYLTKLFGDYMKLPPKREQDAYSSMILEASIEI